MTLVGANIDNSVNIGKGPYVFRVLSQIYHWIGSMCPDEGNPPRFLHLYICDTTNEVNNRLAHFCNNHESELKKEIVEGLIKVLDNHNALVQLFRTARDKYIEADIPEFKLKLYNVVGTRQYESQTAETFGAIVFAQASGTENDFDLIVEEHSCFPQRVNKLYPCYMSLQFPLLFIYDEDGYNKDMKLANVLGQYTKADKRLGDRDGSDLGLRNVLTASFTGGPRYIDLGLRNVLTASFTGGPRYMYAHYLDALAICRVYKSPSFFITFTCNAKWPEIEEFMEQFPQLTTTDRADIVDRVFEKKVRDYINFVRSSNTFGDVTVDKTFMWKAITSALRLEEQTVLAVASSGITSLLLPADEAIPQGNDGCETELLYPKEYLNSLKFAGLPPHRLELIVGTENYQICAMMLALEGKNKIGFIDGSCRRSNVNEVLGRQWDRVNAIVLGWILNSIFEELFLGQIFSKRAKHVWDELKETYDKVDGYVTFNLHHKINSMCQIEDFKRHNQLMKLMQFLMGLDNSYMQIRSSILSRDPLPDVRGAYAIISSEESHRVVSSSNSRTSQRSQSSMFNYVVGNFRGNAQRYQTSGNTSRPSNVTRPPGYVSRRTNGGPQLVCEICGFNGHVGDRCFKVIGYPTDFAGVIVDSSANQHLTYTDKLLVNVIDICKLGIKVSHPNGTEAVITNIGNMILNKNLTLYDVLVVPEYCVRLMSVHKVARDSGLIVAFNENKCFVLPQDLKGMSVLGIGNQIDGLYNLNDSQGTRRYVTSRSFEGSKIKILVECYGSVDIVDVVLILVVVVDSTLYPPYVAMAAPGPSNVIARRVVDELFEFNGETSVSNALTFFNAQQIVECRCFINRMRDEVEISETLIGQLNALIAKLEWRIKGNCLILRCILGEDRCNENAKLLGLNDLIAQALKEIEAKEARVDAANNSS
uniref:DNA helicase n=1 Tax=Tanacetum cinerariifolium TaxID=118510 RepID=A0A6L2MI39_TANCI|nr:DNA helicase [Tanacetum cinerariifolium]